MSAPPPGPTAGKKGGKGGKGAGGDIPVAVAKAHRGKYSGLPGRLGFRYCVLHRPGAEPGWTGS